MKEQRMEIKLSRKDFIANYPHFRYWKKNAAEDMLAEEPVNIYIHIPFCIQKCAFCYYRTEKFKNVHELDDYVNAVCREIEMANRKFHFKERPVNTVYIGGGTPTLLKEDMLERLVQCLRDNFHFEEPEFTLEAEPRTITAKRVAAYKGLGVNRISIGVQSFHDEIIQLSERHHTGQKALQAIDIVKNTGDIVINIDLLSGLAGETNETFATSLDTAINSGTHSITVYRMEVYLNTEFFKQSVRRKLVQLPSEEQELEFMRVAMDKFEAADYKPWSFFTYTRKGDFAHQYAVNIWKGQDLCAFGSSSFGMLGNYNYQNANDLNSYMEMVNEKKLPIIRGYRITHKDHMIKDLLLGMKLSRLSRRDYLHRHGIDFCQVLPETVEELRADGFILVDDEAVTLDRKGLLYGDYVGKRLAYALKEYLGLDELKLY
jgi:oxygen-independent coproporphyrinogen-3 oxidase